jgi:glutaminyl-tRNA synthetase
VSASHAVPAEVRLYDRLFLKENPDEVPEGETFLANLNPDSLKVLTDCRVERMLGAAAPGSRFQFERLGYFCADLKDSKPGGPVFNRVVTLKDTWAKIERTMT